MGRRVGKQREGEAGEVTENLYVCVEEKFLFCKMIKNYVLFFIVFDLIWTRGHSKYDECFKSHENMNQNYEMLVDSED